MTDSQAVGTTSETTQTLPELETRTIIVLDTSVLAADPDAIHAFPGTDIVLPLTVIEELDRLKTRPDDVGRNARTVVRDLEELRLDNDGSLQTAVPLPNGGTIRIEPNGLRLDELEQFHLDPTVADHRILAAARGLSGDTRGTVKVISADGAMRLKADTLGLVACDYVRAGPILRPEKNPGWHTIDVSPGCVEKLYASRFVTMGDLPEYDQQELAAMHRNEFGVLRAGKQSALVRRVKDGIVVLEPEKNVADVWGIKSKNKEQRFALELLTDPDVEVVALSGRAGTGKTLLAIAAALQQTFEPAAKVYDRVMILRPMFSVGKQDIGFLPGDVAEKVAPWFDAVVDAMLAMNPQATPTECRTLMASWVEAGQLSLEPVTFLRGRSLSRTLVIVDEAQNLEPSTIKTILTRLGKGSKVVVVGDPDPSQSDNPFTNATNNGVTHLVSAFTGVDLFGHVLLRECERSRIADLAADLL